MFYRLHDSKQALFYMFYRLQASGNVHVIDYSSLEALRIPKYKLLAMYSLSVLNGLNVSGSIYLIGSIAHQLVVMHCSVDLIGYTLVLARYSIGLLGYTLILTRSSIGLLGYTLVLTRSSIGLLGYTLVLTRYSIGLLGYTVHWY